MSSVIYEFGKSVIGTQSIKAEEIVMRVTVNLVDGDVGARCSYCLYTPWTTTLGVTHIHVSLGSPSPTRVLTWAAVVVVHGDQTGRLKSLL